MKIYFVNLKSITLLLLVVGAIIIIFPKLELLENKTNQRDSTNEITSLTENERPPGTRLKIRVTPSYSNALQSAVLPRISEAISLLNLPIEHPITPEQVSRFNPDSEPGQLGGAIFLTNGWNFVFDPRGFVSGINSPDNWFHLQNLEDYPNYLGKTTMSKREMIEFARSILLKLGYTPEFTHSDKKPELTMPGDLKNGKGHIPYAQVRWETDSSKCPDGPDDATPEEFEKIRLKRVEFYEKTYRVRVDINTQDKKLVGLSFHPARIQQIGTPVVCDVQPETQTMHELLIERARQLGEQEGIRERIASDEIQQKLNFQTNRILRLRENRLNSHRSR